MKSAMRFSAILQLRKWERDEAAMSLADLDAAAREIEHQQQAITMQRKSYREARQRGTSGFRSGVISAHELKSIADYDQALQHAESQLLEQRDELQAQVQQAHQRLTAAQLEFVRIEKLHLLERSRQQCKIHRQEQREADELITLRYETA